MPGPGRPLILVRRRYPQGDTTGKVPGRTPDASGKVPGTDAAEWLAPASFPRSDAEMGPAEGTLSVVSYPSQYHAGEVARRVKALRRQLAEWVASGRPGVPLLVLPEAPAPTLGRCVSCGEPVTEGCCWRCDTCRQAVRVVLGMVPTEEPECHPPAHPGLAEPPGGAP